MTRRAHRRNDPRWRRGLRKLRAHWPRSTPAWGLVLVALTSAALLHVRGRLAVVRLGYALSAAADEHRRLEAERRKLSVEVATLRSPRRLRKVAVERLGLVEPRPEQILRLGSQTEDLAVPHR